MPHASSPPLQHRLQSTCITKMYTFPCFIQSRPLSFLSVSRVLLWNTHCPVGGQDILLKVYRVFFVNESEKFRGETNPLIRGGYIFTNVPPLFSPSSVLLLVIPSGTFPNPLPLRRKLWFPLLFFFSFLFVAIVSQWLIVQGTATMCSVLQNCTRYVERKNLGRTNTVIHSSTF